MKSAVILAILAIVIVSAAAQTEENMSLKTMFSRYNKIKKFIPLTEEEALNIKTKTTEAEEQANIQADLVRNSLKSLWVGTQLARTIMNHIPFNPFEEEALNTKTLETEEEDVIGSFLYGFVGTIINHVTRTHFEEEALTTKTKTTEAEEQANIQADLLRNSIKSLWIGTQVARTIMNHIPFNPFEEEALNTKTLETEEEDIIGSFVYGFVGTVINHLTRTPIFEEQANIQADLVRNSMKSLWVGTQVARTIMNHIPFNPFEEEAVNAKTKTTATHA